MPAPPVAELHERRSRRDFGLPPSLFRECFIAQAQQRAPSAAAPGCDAPGGTQLPAPARARVRARVSSVLTAAVSHARENDFEAAVQQALPYQI